MPCYNDGAYIEQSIASVFAQTYSDIELIVIDDGSTEKRTLDILSRLTDPRLKLIRSKRTYPAGARNLGISQAIGTYILPLDADDLIEPTYIEKAVGILQKKQEVGIVYCEADFIGAGVGKWKLPPFTIERMLMDNIIFVSALFRKTDWEAVGGFCTELEYGVEDYDFFLSLIERGTEVEKIPETLFHCRIKSKSRTSAFMEDREKIKSTYEKIYYRHHALYQKYADVYVNRMRNALTDYYLDYQELKEKKLARRAWKRIKQFIGMVRR